MFTLKLGKVKIDNPAKTEKRLGLDKDGSGQEFLRNEFDRFMDPYIPYSGRGSGMKGLKTYPTKHSIRYTSPYAHYDYIGKLYLASNGSSWAKKGEKKHITGISLKFSGAPKRGPRWDKRMYSDRKSDILRDLEKFLKKGGN